MAILALRTLSENPLDREDRTLLLQVVEVALFSRRLLGAIGHSQDHSARRTAGWPQPNEKLTTDNR
ncbi:hypothetical protein AMJ85_02605 [candidate division BRC1 bacterium SM23_51]|nr:MAG: hypothetical protein AMJ85_02605 [candidate division BRC1 bacterium SM23_51]